MLDTKHSSSRFTKLGIKQTIQLSWMDRVLKMVLAGATEQEIRADLHEFLSTQKQSGGVGERGKVSYAMAISILACWFAPSSELIAFRDRLLEEVKTRPQKDWVVLHWAIISASYPFWFSVARQVGRLFNLQDQITQPQIFNRLKEQYGDRETVARNARYAVRSMVAWSAIEDTDVKGRYQACKKPVELDLPLTALLIESALHTIPDGKSTLSNILSEPALFYFKLYPLSTAQLTDLSETIQVSRFGMGDDYLKLN